MTFEPKARAMLSDVHLSVERRAEHIMAMPVPVPGRSGNRRWTSREVRQLIADAPLASPRYELVDGELLVTPSPNWPHQHAVSILLVALEQYLKPQRVGHASTSPFDVELEPETVLQPDIFVIPMNEVRRLRTEMPARELLLAAEVLSPSSGRYDRVKKKPVYLRHVPEYWIVDLDARIFERWQAGDERPRVLTDSIEWQPAGASELFRLDLVRYFAEVFGDDENDN